MINIKCYKAREFCNIENDWKVLECGSDMTIFQSYQWIGIYNQEYLNRGFYAHINKHLEYWVVYKNEKIVLIFPCEYSMVLVPIKASIHMRRQLSFIGKKNYTDYCNMIYSEFKPQYVEALFEEILNQYGRISIVLEGLIQGTDFEKYMREKWIPSLYKAVYVNLEASEKEYTNLLSKSTRQNLRTAMNRMDKDNIDYSYKVFKDAPTSDLICQLLSLHLKRNLEKNKKANAVLNYMRKLKQQYVERNISIIPKAMVLLDCSWFLVVYLNGEIAGYLYGLVDGKTIRILQNCLNSKFGYYSPIFRAAYDFILKCTKEENRCIETLDFTSGDESYKYKLNGKENILCSYKIIL